MAPSLRVVPSSSASSSVGTTLIEQIVINLITHIAHTHPQILGPHSSLALVVSDKITASAIANAKPNMVNKFNNDVFDVRVIGYTIYTLDTVYYTRDLDLCTVRLVYTLEIYSILKKWLIAVNTLGNGKYYIN